MQRAEAHVYFNDTIGLGEWFWGTTLSDVRYCVEGYYAFGSEQVPDSELPAKVILHFPACKGGDVVEGYGIYNYLRGLAAKGVAIETRVEGLCASIAVLIALAADSVLMADAALWMVHKPSSCGAGNADELRAEADVLDKIQAQMVGRYVARTGGKLTAETAHDLINRTSWLTADECLALGFITGKLADAPLTVPEGADAVLNYFPTKKTAPAMAVLNAAEKKSFLAELKEEIKSWFPKNEADPATVPAVPAATNSSADVTDNDPMYYEGDALAADTAVYSDEAMTVAYPDGQYALADGRSATVAAGVVTVLTDAAAEDNAATNSAADEALATENTDLKAQNALLQRQLTAAKNKLKNAVPGSTGNPNQPGSQQVVPRASNKATPAAGAAFSIRKV